MQGSQTRIYDFLRARLKKMRNSCSFVIQCYKFHLYFMYTPTSLKAESVQFCHHHCQVKKKKKKKRSFSEDISFILQAHSISLLFSSLIHLVHLAHTPGQ